MPESTPNTMAEAVRLERLARAVAALAVRAAEAPSHLQVSPWVKGSDPVLAFDPEPPGPIPEIAMRAGVTPEHLDRHERARVEAERVYDRALRRYVTLAEAAALKRKRRRQEDEEELLAAWLLLMDNAAAQAYVAAGTRLAGAMPPAPGGGHGGGPSSAVTPPTRANGQQFARTRHPLIAPIGQTILERLDHAAQEAEAAGLDEGQTREHVEAAGDDLLEGQGEVISSTEAQAVYGHAQLRLLQQAGFATKMWITMQDERVRPTHTACEEEGPIPLHKRFSNGLLFPGDPAGGPEEVCNCRCDLVGVERKPAAGAGPVKASEPAGHPFHGNQYQTVGAGFIPAKHALKKPIKGPTGAAIVGYEWRHTMGMKWDARRQEDVEAKVSDWGNAEESTGTKRHIVHVFHVLHPDGVVRPEGINSAQQVLGIAVSRLKTIAKNEAAAQAYREQMEKAEAESWEKHAKATPAEAAQLYRSSNYSPMRTQAENDQIFYQSVLFEKGGKYLRRHPQAADLMLRHGWSKAEHDPAKPTPQPATA